MDVLPVHSRLEAKKESVFVRETSHFSVFKDESLNEAELRKMLLSGQFLLQWKSIMIYPEVITETMIKGTFCAVQWGP